MNGVKILWILLIATIMSGCNDSSGDYPARTMPDRLMTDAVALQMGHDLFMAKCADCHGKPSEGRSDRAIFFEPPAPDFTEAHFRQTDPAYLYWRIEAGKNVEPYLSQGSVMPAWGMHLTTDQIWQLVAYLKARSA